MLDSFTLFFASIAIMIVMTFLNFLTWRTNKNTPGTLLYIFYPVLLLGAAIGFTTVVESHNLVIISIATLMMFSASLVHCLSLSQFLNFRGLSFKLLCSFTLFSAVMLIYYSFINPSLEERILASDLQHIAEAIFLLYI
ncbi:MAG: hybrid sensor histidine kinase/response regulator, partial [Pseudoalteromonas sp.]